MWRSKSDEHTRKLIGHRDYDERANVLRISRRRRRTARGDYKIATISRAEGGRLHALVRRHPASDLSLQSSVSENVHASSNEPKAEQYTRDLE